MTAFILPLANAVALDPEKRRAEGGESCGAGAVRSADAGRFCITAEAYRHQARHIGIEKMLAEYNAADIPTYAAHVDRHSVWRSIRGRSRRKFSNRCSPPGARSRRNFRKA